MYAPTHASLLVDSKIQTINHWIRIIYESYRQRRVR
jgi:hypothetical protein